MKIGLIMILHNYTVHLCEKIKNPWDWSMKNLFSFIMCPKDGLYLKITKDKK